MVIVDAYKWLTGKEIDKVGFSGRVLGGGLGLYIAPEVAVGWVATKQAYNFFTGSSFDPPSQMFAEASMIITSISLLSSYTGKYATQAVVGFFKKLLK